MTTVLRQRPRLARPAAAAPLDRPYPAARALRQAVRLALGLVVATVALTGGDGSPSDASWAVLSFATVYCLASTAMAAVPGWRRSLARSQAYFALGDILVLCGLALAANDTGSPLLLFLCAIPLGYSLTMAPTVLAGTTAAAISGAFLVWAAAPAFGTSGVSDGYLLALSLALVWSGVISCLIAVERERRSNRIDELSGTLHDLIGQVIAAEATERQRVADLLHDDVLQLLMVTRHDVTDAIEGDLSALPNAGTGIDAATRHLRETIGGLRTDGVAADRLGDGLTLLADQSARRRGFTVDVDVPTDVHDRQHPLLLSLARDLLRTTERSSAATTMTLTVREEGTEMVLQLRHDDRRHNLPLDTASVPGAVAPIEQRARAAGGSLLVDQRDDGDRQLTVRIPTDGPTSSGAGSHSDFSPPRRRGSRRRPRTPRHSHKAPHDVQSR